MTSKYGWIVTRDHLADEDSNDAGTVGPRNICPDIAARLKAGEGRAWKAKDDDGETYYDGRIICDDDDYLFAPLEDFAMPNAGATEILYKNGNGPWSVL